MPSVKLTKKSGQQKSAAKGAKATPGSFAIQDNEDGSFTVFGSDAAGAGGIDLSSAATLTPPPTSSDPSILSVDPPNGMTDAVHGLKPGTADLTITATFNDGSAGPFTVTIPCTVKQGPATGLDVTFGTPTVR